jgi:hypothetical protein
MASKPTHGGPRPGSGRPKGDRQQITLMLSAATVSRLDAAAPTRIEQAEIIDYLVRRSKKLTPTHEKQAKP